MLKKISLAILKLFRKLFSGTPVQSWTITSKIYAFVFHGAYGKGDIDTTYKTVKLTLPAKDTTIVPSIVGGYFESMELDAFKLLSAKSNNSIIDVGGNVGLYSILAAKYTKSKIISFEPIAENIEYFQKNIKKKQS